MLAEGPGQESRGAQSPAVPQPCSQEKKPHSCLSPPHCTQKSYRRSLVGQPPNLHLTGFEAGHPQHCLALQTGNSIRKASLTLSGLGFQPQSLGHITKENVPLPRPGSAHFMDTEPSTQHPFLHMELAWKSRTLSFSHISK